MSNRIFIPVRQSSEVVEIRKDSLPQVIEEVLDLLQAEFAPLSLWIEVAKAYLDSGNRDGYEQLLKEGINEETQNHFAAEDIDTQQERVQILCALGAYHTEQGQAITDKSDDGKRDQRNLYLQANRLLTQAFRLRKEVMPSIGLGQLQQAQGDYESAEKHFTDASTYSSKGRRSIAGDLALAALYCRRERFQEASRLYSQAIRQHPGCGAEVRLGLGVCYAKLGQAKLAQACFRRALQLKPGCSSALLGLATLTLRGPSSKDESQQDGFQLLCQAFEADPSQPGVLNLLAAHSLAQGNSAQAKELAEQAVGLTASAALKADAQVVLARAHHARRELAAAQKLYTLAHEADKTLPLPLLGLAQFHLLQQHHQAQQATSLLESALASQPGWTDAIQVLGWAYLRDARLQPTSTQLQLLRDAAAQASSNPMLWEVLGDAVAATSSSEALQAYTKAVDLHRQSRAQQAAAAAKAARRAWKAEARAAVAEGSSPPPEPPPLPSQPQEPLPAKLLNNAAVLFMRTGRATAALELLEEAFQAAQSEAGRAGLPALSQVTLGYNRARVQEACSQLLAAANAYKGILAQLPGYLDCYIRLAMIAHGRGDAQQAWHWSVKALEQCQAAQTGASGSRQAEKRDLADATALKGMLLLEAEQWSETERLLHATVRDKKNDPYGWMALGVMNLRRWQLEPKPAKDADAEKRLQKFQNEAMNCFKACISCRPSSVQAAHGVAAVQASRGDLATAAKLLAKVQESAPEGTDKWHGLVDMATNTASLLLGQHRFRDAVQLYAATSTRFLHNTDAQLLLYQARCLHHEHNNAGAQRLLLQALHLAPQDQILRFNIALQVQEQAQGVLLMKAGQASVAQLTEALSNAHSAQRFFQSLARMSAPPVPRKRLDQHLAFNTRQLEEARKRLQEAQQEEAGRAKKAEHNRLVLEAAQRQQQLADAKIQAAEAEAKALREQQALEAALKLQALREKWNVDKAHAEAAEEGNADKVDKRRKRKKAEAQDAAFIEEDNDGDYQAKPTSKKGRKSAKRQPASDEDPWQKGSKSEGASPEPAAPLAEEEDLGDLHTGLTSDEDEPDTAPKSSSPPQSAPENGHPLTAGRLKRHNEGVPLPEQASGLDEPMEELGGGLADDLAHDLKDPGELQQAAGGRAARRRAAVLDDSDEE